MLPLTPTKLGRYEIVDEIGKGAMGVVYLARDPLIGRLVALKTFRIGYSVKDAELDQFRARFIREAQSAGILSHPNIVTIHDVVEKSDDGLAFIAMEYVRGTNLKSVLQEDRRPPLPYVTSIISQMGDALDYAHSCKVIHRDIKPANILITADDRVKITDFGIARLDTSNLTQEGQLLGTPNYMSPEQILGRDIDARADIFSLGVVLYEMLTRHKPFQGENLTVVSHRIVYDHFTPPREYVDDLPPGTEAILNKALEKDPVRRYQRARDLAGDLQRVLAEVSPRDPLNETQSLSATAALPAERLAALIQSQPTLVVSEGPGGPTGTYVPGAHAARAASAPPSTPSAVAPLAQHAGPHTPPAVLPLPTPVTPLNAERRKAAPDRAAEAQSPRPSRVLRMPGAPFLKRLIGGAGKPDAGAEPPGNSRPQPLPAPAAGGDRQAQGRPTAVNPSPVPAAAQIPPTAASSGPSAASFRHATRPSAPPPLPPSAAGPAAAPAPGPAVAAGSPGAASPAPPVAAIAPGAPGVPLASVASLASVPPLAASALPAASASEVLPAPQAAGGEPMLPMPPMPPMPPIPQAPAAGAEAIPLRPARPGPLSTSVGRALMLGAAALVLTVAVCWGLFLWARQQAPSTRGAVDAVADAKRVTVMQLMRDGRRLLENGDPRGAAAAYREAERLAPDLAPSLQKRRDDAERQAAERDRRLDIERTIALKLEEAHADLAGRRYDEAAVAAAAVLQMSPGNTAAEEVQSAVQAVQQRRKDRLTSPAVAAKQQVPHPPEASAAGQPVAASRAASTPPGTAPEKATDATLELAFFSELPEGTVMLYVNDRKVLHKPFDFHEKGGLSGFFRTKAHSDWVRGSFAVPAGSAKIRLYVTPQGRAAQVWEASGNFAGGATRRLDATLSSAGTFTCNLNPPSN
jgi:serine/threonine protein kinase